MKTANEMRAIAMEKNSTIEMIETYVAPQIENAANAGEFSCRIEVDKICVYYTRPATVALVADYLQPLGYSVSSCYNGKYMDIAW